MPRSFNTTGPCIPGEHYMIPPERRLGRALRLIEDRKYFTLHAGRQTGKTTSLMWLARHLNASGRWRAVWVDLETAREQPDPAVAMPIILENLDRALEQKHAALARPDAAVIEAALRQPATALSTYLGRLAALEERPLALLFDEVDGLVGPAMVSFLTQLRAGYISRSETPFPASVVLVGLRAHGDHADLGARAGPPVADVRAGGADRRPRREGPERRRHGAPRRGGEGDDHPRAALAHRLADRAADRAARAPDPRAHAGGDGAAAKPHRR